VHASTQPTYLTHVHSHPCHYFNTRTLTPMPFSADQLIPFTKPKDLSTPTFHLYCCNSPPLQAGSDWRTHSLVEFCSAHGQIKEFYSISGKSWVFLSFNEISQAMAAMQVFPSVFACEERVHVCACVWRGRSIRARASKSARAGLRVCAYA